MILAPRKPTWASVLNRRGPGLQDDDAESFDESFADERLVSLSWCKIKEEELDIASPNTKGRHHSADDGPMTMSGCPFLAPHRNSLPLVAHPAKPGELLRKAVLVHGMSQRGVMGTDTSDILTASDPARPDAFGVIAQTVSAIEAAKRAETDRRRVAAHTAEHNSMVHPLAVPESADSPAATVFHGERRVSQESAQLPIRSSPRARSQSTSASDSDDQAQRSSDGETAPYVCVWGGVSVRAVVLMQANLVMLARLAS